MEATGVYWKPVWHILSDGDFELVLANAAHIKNVPGRKTEARTKGSYLQAQFHRIKARRGPKKAILAVAASILTAIYHMLKDGTLYQDLGPNHFDARSKERQKNRLVRRLAELGYTVELAPITH
jgi:hypothetical protein